jgi:TonB family protein
MNIDTLKQKSAKLKYDIQTRHWPRLVAELETKSLRSLFFRALLLGLLVSVPWQCSRFVYNAYFTESTDERTEQGTPLIGPDSNSGSITKMPNPRARRAPAQTEVVASATVDSSVNADQTQALPEAAAAHPQNQEAKPIHQEAPKYPIEALRNNETGTVQLRVRVDPDGVPADVSIEDSSGSRSLDRAAREAVSQWRFSPKYENGVAVASDILIPVEFKAER